MEKLRIILFVVFLSFLSPFLLLAENSQVSNVVNPKKQSIVIKGWQADFNRAGVFAKQKKYGKSVLYFERAKLIYDGYPPLEKNIRLIKQSTGANRFSLEVNGLIKAIFFYYFYFSRYSLVNLIVVITILFLLFLSYGFYRLLVGKLWFKIVVSLFVFIIGLFAISYFLKQKKDFNENRAIVIEKVKLFGTKNRQNSLTTLPEATELIIEKTDGNIALVTLPSGLSGWVKSDCYSKISIGNNNYE